VISRAGLLAAALVLSAQPAFHYERPVELAPSPTPETCVVLPASLLSHAGLYLQDLRVIGDGREVAYLARISNGVAGEEARPQTILNLGQRNGAVSFDVEMTEPTYRRVVLRIGRSHFSVLIHVTGMERPGARGVSFPEIAYSSNADESDPQQRVITLPESNFRYLHFEIQTLALEPVAPQDIAGVDVLAEKIEPPRYVQVAVANEAEQKPHATVYNFSVAPNVGVDRLTFSSDDPNAIFSRMADLERYPAQPSQADKAHPEVPRQSEGVAFAHAVPKKGETAGPSTIELGLGAVRYASIVRLTIQNGDDAPLKLHGITLAMRERQLCFLQKPDASYVLRYGDPKLGPPQYDLSPLEANLANASLSTLGPERALKPEAGWRIPFTERHPVLLWVALILVVGTLGFVALRSARSSRVGD
jgi:Protein of unknown function (DUF3999)